MTEGPTWTKSHAVDQPTLDLFPCTRPTSINRDCLLNIRESSNRTTFWRAPGALTGRVLLLSSVIPLGSSGWVDIWSGSFVFGAKIEVWEPAQTHTIIVSKQLYQQNLKKILSKNKILINYDRNTEESINLFNSNGASILYFYLVIYLQMNDLFENVLFHSHWLVYKSMRNRTFSNRSFICR